MLNFLIIWTKTLGLTLSWQTSLSYRNQFIGFQKKSMDWFLCDRDRRCDRVKKSSIRLFHLLENLEKVDGSDLLRQSYLLVKSFGERKNNCKWNRFEQKQPHLLVLEIWHYFSLTLPTVSIKIAAAARAMRILCLILAFVWS